MPLPLAALLPIVASLAPGLVRYLAGDRAAEVASQVSTAVGAVVGSDDPAEIAVAMQDPAKAADLRLELARIEQDHETERLRLVLADVAGARGQAVALAQAGSRIAWMAPAVTAAVLALFGAALWVVLTGHIPEANTRMADALLGGIYTLATTAVTYWLGTSRGAVEMRQALQNGGAPAAGPFGR
jgi:hypothetical protein